ncbi:hypothetical protein V8F06_012877 [Rhypophila decipiens]
MVRLHHVFFFFFFLVSGFMIPLLLVWGPVFTFLSIFFLIVSSSLVVSIHKLL